MRSLQVIAVAAAFLLCQVHALDLNLFSLSEKDLALFTQSQRMQLARAEAEIKRLEATAACNPTPAKCPDGSAPTPVNQKDSPANGCGPAMKNQFAEGAVHAVLDGRMTPCCNGHDVCYGKVGSAKATCDGNFLSCMQNACSSLGIVKGTLCKAQARVYHFAVAKGGCGAFAAAQVASGCGNKPEEKKEEKKQEPKKEEKKDDKKAVDGKKKKAGDDKKGKKQQGKKADQKKQQGKKAGKKTGKKKQTKKNSKKAGKKKPASGKKGKKRSTGTSRRRSPKKAKRNSGKKSRRPARKTARSPARRPSSKKGARRPALPRCPPNRTKKARCVAPPRARRR